MHQMYHVFRETNSLRRTMSSSNCYFLTCIQISQKAGQVVWYSLLFQTFPQFIVIHTVKSFGIVKKAEINIFLEFSCFFDNPMDVGNLISGSCVCVCVCVCVFKTDSPPPFKMFIAVSFHLISLAA